jgi:hypothetical protein
MRRLCTTVLIFEAIVIALAIPVAIKVEHMTPGAAGPTGGALAGAAVLIGVLVSMRTIGLSGLKIALIAGSILQTLMIASGAVVPAMYGLGVIFAALWAIAICLGRSAERAQPR